MTWQSPWAAFGLLALVLPVLIHLLARAPAHRRPFPTLRFIDATRLPPRARSRVHDPLLLLVRLIVLALAAAALAQPLFGASRRGKARVARAIIVDTSASMRRPFSTGVAARSAADSARSLARAMTGDSVSMIVVETSAPDAEIAGATSWLSSRPGRREIVILSDFQRGAVDSATLAALPRGSGVRLERVSAGPMPESFRLPAEHPAGSVQVTPLASSTRFAWSGARTPTTIDSTVISVVSVHASDDERARFVAAASRVIGADRVTAAMRDTTSRVLLVLPGAPDRAALLGSARPRLQPWMASTVRRVATSTLLRELARDARHVAMPGARSDTFDSTTVPLFRVEDAALMSAAALDSVRLLLFVQSAPDEPFTSATLLELLRASNAAAPASEHDPRFMSDTALRQLSRPSADSVPASAGTVDDDPVHGGPSDARWLWSAALLALLVEWRLRRSSGADT